jgi:hypothetical protein
MTVWDCAKSRYHSGPGGSDNASPLRRAQNPSSCEKPDLDCRDLGLHCPVLGGTQPLILGCCAYFSVATTVERCRLYES